ncbi:MAG: DUF2922 domain-containing protein [Sedimentibacter sp.]
MAKRLVMAFKTVEGTTSTLTVDEPKADLTAAEVRAVMDTIVAQNIFNTNSGDLIEVKSAEIITTTEEIISLE